MRRPLRRWLVATVLTLVLGPESAHGQGWVVDLSAGAAEYEALAGDVGTVNAIFGIRREAALWMTFAGGVPLDSSAVPWASGGVGSRWSHWVGRIELGIDAAALGFGYRVSELSATGGGATLIALPFAAFTFGDARVEARTGVLHHTDYFESESSSRTISENALRARLTVQPGVSVSAEGRLVGAEEAHYPYLGAAAELIRGPAEMWIRAGRWVADALDTGGWGVGGRVNVGRRLAVRAAYERQPDDPLYWNGARSSWTVGVSRSFGSAGGIAVRLPPPETFHTPAGPVSLRIDADEAQDAPSIAGDFTDWQPVPMKLRDGDWQASFDLPAGVYHYSFQRADGTWFLPDSVPNRVDDGFGGVNGVLVVVAP